MKDPISVERIATLHPAFRQIATDFIDAAEQHVGGIFRITEAFRSFEYQNGLYASGRTKPGKIVTRARGGQSYHNYGTAIDVVPMVNAKPDWTFDYNLLRPVYLKFPLTWGADWDRDGKTKKEGDADEKLIDYPHYQLYPQPHWSELLKRYDAKDFVNKFTKFVRL